jgi:hypothetical protein
VITHLEIILAPESMTFILKSNEVGKWVLAIGRCVGGGLTLSRVLLKKSSF